MKECSLLQIGLTLLYRCRFQRPSGKWAAVCSSAVKNPLPRLNLAQYRRPFSERVL